MAQESMARTSEYVDTTQSDEGNVTYDLLPDGSFTLTMHGRGGDVVLP